MKVISNCIQVAATFDDLSDPFVEAGQDKPHILEMMKELQDLAAGITSVFGEELGKLIEGLEAETIPIVTLSSLGL